MGVEDIACSDHRDDSFDNCFLVFDIQVLVELTKFELGSIGNEVLIEKETASEINNDYLAGERSIDGATFEIPPYFLSLLMIF